MSKRLFGLMSLVAALGVGDGAMADCFEKIREASAKGAWTGPTAKLAAPPQKEGDRLEVIMVRRAPPRGVVVGLGTYEGQDVFVWRGTALRTVVTPLGPQEQDVQVVYVKRTQPTARGERAQARLAKRANFSCRGLTLREYMDEGGDSEFECEPWGQRRDPDQEDFHADG